MENAKEVITEFERRMNTKVRRLEKFNLVKEQDFKRGELPGKYTIKILYRWDDGMFEKEYLRKLERNWQK